MDKIQALKILHLAADASLEDAKKSYRFLARKYHPDLLPCRNGQITSNDSKMKQINLAYRFLVSVLEPEKKHEHSAGVAFKNPEAQNKTGTWLARLRQIFLNCFHGIGLSGRAETQPEYFKKNRAEKFVPAFSGQSFDKILKNAGHGLNASGRNPYRPGCPGKFSGTHNIHAGYRRYMILKNRMALIRPARHEMPTGGRITPVQPVTRVKPLRYE
jgi:curved DNA-binding protein CbpA